VLSHGPVQCECLYAFTPTGTMGKPSYLHTATLLKNGMVLIAGGVDPGNGPGAIADTELYNPEAGLLSLPASCRWRVTGQPQCY